MFKLFKKDPITEPTKTKFKMFERVTHAKFGDGVINAIYPDKSCWVAFERNVAKVSSKSLKKSGEQTTFTHTRFPTPS